MPVIGHSFVGLATAMCVKPAAPRPSGQGLWVPMIVGLAYLPDIAGEILRAIGAEAAQTISHSVVFAVAAGVAVGGLLRWTTGLRFRATTGVAILTILMHDALDLLQATGRVPWWPVSGSTAAPNLAILPTNVTAEAAMFAGFFAVFLVFRWVILRRRAPREEPHAAAIRPSRFRRIGYALTLGILVAAAVTHVLRGIRETALAHARAHLEEGAYVEAIRDVDAAAAWPATAKRGKLHYLRACALAGLGDRAEAERYLVRACRSSPDYFWPVADLAVMRARSSAPLEVRRARTAPLVARLKTRFADHDRLRHVLDKIDRALGDP